MWLLPACSFAAKALTEWQAFTQPDGSVLVLSLSGDERGYCYVDMSGTAYMPDSMGVFRVVPREQRAAGVKPVRRAGAALNATATNTRITIMVASLPQLS